MNTNEVTTEIKYKGYLIKFNDRKNKYYVKSPNDNMVYLESKSYQSCVEAIDEVVAEMEAGNV